MTPKDSSEYGKLTENELRWMATLPDYSLPQVISGKKEWIIMPIRDIGGVVDEKIVGTTPG